MITEAMSRQQHWEAVYETKAADAVSWYRPHLERSLALIERATPDRDAAILDVGGGASALVDDLLARGYRSLSVLDISAKPLRVVQQRLGARAADDVTWLAADLHDAQLPEAHYDVWHDRAMFHFLTEPEQRAGYLRQLAHAPKPGGHVVIATFGTDGPMKCSGLDTMRYDADTLAHALGPGFMLIDSVLERHATPLGTSQQFLCALFQRVAPANARVP